MNHFRFMSASLFKTCIRGRDTENKFCFCSVLPSGLLWARIVTTSPLGISKRKSTASSLTTPWKSTLLTLGQNPSVRQLVTQLITHAAHLHSRCKLAVVELNTLRIWSPTRRPSSSAGLPSWTLAMKMPTSFPPASRSPTLSPFWKFTITVFGLYKGTACNMFSHMFVKILPFWDFSFVIKMSTEKLSGVTFSNITSSFIFYHLSIFSELGCFAK